MGEGYKVAVGFYAPGESWQPQSDLPEGLHFDSAKGVLSGVPVSTGEYKIALRVPAAVKVAARRAFSDYSCCRAWMPLAV